jgi:hypothetical protein
MWNVYNQEGWHSTDQSRNVIRIYTNWSLHWKLRRPLLTVLREVQV